MAKKKKNVCHNIRRKCWMTKKPVSKKTEIFGGDYVQQWTEMMMMTPLFTRVAWGNDILKRLYIITQYNFRMLLRL